MSCFTCTANFGWRKKEYGCPSCGKAFCKDCLNHTIVLAKLGNKESKVCVNCYKQSVTPSSSIHSNKLHGKAALSTDDPSVYLGPSMKDISSKQKKPVNSTQEFGKDAEIKARLDELKKDSTKKTLTDEQLMDKFNALSGQNARPSGPSQNTNILLQQNRLTEAEEVLNLMKQTKDEVAIDDRYHENSDSDTEGDLDDKIKDMETRLYKLKGVDPEVAKKEKQRLMEGDDTSEDEEDAAKRILQKAIAESGLDDKLKADGYDGFITNAGSGKSNDAGQNYPAVPKSTPGAKAKFTFSRTADDPEDEELPWCCICNEDASLRCHDCDGDLYCKRCFREGHNDDYEMKHHRKSPYKPPKK